MLKENFSILMGESPGDEFISRVRETSLFVEGVEDVRNIRTEYVGPNEVHMGLDIKVKGDTPIREAEEIGERVRKKIHEAIEMEGKHCYVQVRGQRD